MSAARLREAAALLRERAEAAPGGSWVYSETGNPVNGPTGVEVRSCETGHPVMTGAYDSHDGYAAAYIAMMHPPVALALADWLDTAARLLAASDMADAVGPPWPPLAVADAILGGER